MDWYDPWEHAARLGVRVERHPLAGTQWGRYLHDRQLIVLRPGLSDIQARATLAHEVVHAEYGDRDTADRITHIRQERRADDIAAQRLISQEALARVARVHAYPQLIAAELGVPMWLLNAYHRRMQLTHAS